jgi:hypothetical protein
MCEGNGKTTTLLLSKGRVFSPKQRKMLAASSGDKMIDQKYLESSEMRCCRRLKKISWTDLLRNEKYYIESRRRGISYKQ